MSSTPYGPSRQKSPTLFHKGLATLTRMGRGASPPSAQKGANPLREVFTDLMAYVIFFGASCAQHPPAPAELREKILALINAQEDRVKASGVSVDVFREARFAVLSWVDEMILNSNWPHRTQWQHLMLTYYETLNAGEEFFRRLQRLPSQANDVREIYYLCLSLGFQGRYAFGDDQHELRDLKQGLYKQLCGTNGDIRQSYPRLFPEAYQKAPPVVPAAARTKPLWYIVACLVPVLLFICYWLLLRNETNRLLAMIEKKRVFESPPVEWGRSLVEELRRKGFRAVDEPEGVRITLESLLFKPGSARLDPQAETKINDIVATVKRHAPERPIAVEGHASREIAVDEPRNQKLSEDRATTVADTFVRAAFNRDRISAHGFGSKKPVALNDTEEGRSQNRRVEIIVKK